MELKKHLKIKKGGGPGKCVTENTKFLLFSNQCYEEIRLIIFHIKGEKG